MRTREIERKVKKVLNPRNYTLEVWREDETISLEFRPWEYITKEEINTLCKTLNAQNCTILATDLGVYVDFYYNA